MLSAALVQSKPLRPGSAIPAIIALGHLQHERRIGPWLQAQFLYCRRGRVVTLAARPATQVNQRVFKPRALFVWPTSRKAECAS
jgi:hypothetical protein